MAIPEATEQLRFLTNIQRILDEGSFVTTYKFALLMTLADYAVTRGDDSGDSITLQVSALSEGFVSYYWKQVLPYQGAVTDGQSPSLLKYGIGNSMPAVVQKIIALHNDASVQGSLYAAKRMPAWNQLISSTTVTIKSMPLWKLQVLRDGVLPFLYQQEMRGSTIILQPGVIYCLRKHYNLLRSLIQGAWVHTVRKWNRQILGHTELNDFLFGAQRQTTQQVVELLREFQSGRCFYCDGTIRGRGDVDHFIPWVRYPLHLGHNFVLSHERCNRQKSDRLASLSEYERWWERNNQNQDLSIMFDQADIIHDLPLTNAVGQWAYRAL